MRIVTIKIDSKEVEAKLKQMNAQGVNLSDWFVKQVLEK